MDDVWYQQDGATCHSTTITIELLGTVFENRIINRNSEVVWPAWNCVLTHLDYFLWGTVKDKCYTNHPETIDDFIYEIEEGIHEILPRTIRKLLENWVN